MEQHSTYSLFSHRTGYDEVVRVGLSKNSAELFIRNLVG
jgi:hypothetical protein